MSCGRFAGSFRKLASEPGWASTCAWNSASISLCARASETPGFKRPIIGIDQKSFSSRNECPFTEAGRFIGAQISKFAPGSIPVKYSGFTPMMVTGNIIQSDGLADHGGAAGKPAGPIFVADQRHGPSCVRTSSSGVMARPMTGETSIPRIEVSGDQKAIHGLGVSIYGGRYAAEFLEGEQSDRRRCCQADKLLVDGRREFGSGNTLGRVSALFIHRFRRWEKRSPGWVRSNRHLGPAR